MKQVNYKAVLSSLLTKKASENRYVVEDLNGQVLLNNDNRGYTSKNKALAAYELKTFGKVVDDGHDVSKKRRADVKSKYEAHQPTQEELEEFFNG